MFSQINSTLLTISKSKSNVNLHLHDLIKSASSAQINKVQEETPKEISEKAKEKTPTQNKNLVQFEKKEAPKPPSPKPELTRDSILAKKREEERERMERMRMSKKLDDVFGVLRSEPVEDIRTERTEIKIRGMGDVSLQQKGPPKKSAHEHNKPDEYELKRAARSKIAMPDKPATYKKPKPKPKEKSPSPKPPPKPKKSCFVFIPKPVTPPPERPPTPDLATKFWPTPKLPTPEPAPCQALRPPPAPAPTTSKSSLKIGINGFDRVGRLAFRAAFLAGLEVRRIDFLYCPS